MWTLHGTVAAALALVPTLPIPAALSEGQDALRPGEVVTIAGTSEPGFSGDGGDARDAQLGEALALDVGPDGTVYIADLTNARVRAVSPDGTIYTLAKVDHLTAVAVDHAGAVYIATDYHVVRIDPGGGQTRIGGPAQRGDPDVSIPGDNGPATKAHINEPFDIAVGADGTVYLAEVQGIRAIGTDGVIRPVAGGGRLDLAEVAEGPATDMEIFPERVAVDSRDTVYFTQHLGDSAHIVGKVDRNGTVTRFAGTPGGGQGDGGPAIEARLGSPDDLYVDDQDAVYIAARKQVRRVGTDGTITTVGRSLDPVWGVAVGPDGNLYIAGDSQVSMLVPGDALGIGDPVPQAPDPWVDQPAGTVFTVADGGIGECPSELAVSPSGTLYIGQCRTGPVYAVEPDGTVVSHQIGEESDTDVRGIAVGYDGSVYVARPSVFRRYPDGVEVFGFSKAISGLAIGPDGDLYFSWDSLRNDRDQRIYRMGPGGELTSLGSVSGDPRAVAIGDRAVHVAVAGSDESTTISGGSPDGTPPVEIVAHSANGIAVDPDGNVYLSTDDEIRRIGTSGAVITVYESPQGTLGGLAVDGHGNLYFAEPANGRIQVLVRPTELRGPAQLGILAVPVGAAMLLIATAFVMIWRRRAPADRPPVG